MESPSKTPSYLPIHLYTILQIVITIVIFIVTLTRAAPAFPVLIIALVPFRLLVMKKWWPREVLRFVDAWACREGTPEDDEDAEKLAASPTQEPSDGAVLRQAELTVDGSTYPGKHTSSVTDSQADIGLQRTWAAAQHNAGQEWIELEEREIADEEFGHNRR